MSSTNFRNLEAVLRNFNLQELRDIALQEFPEITWDKIQDSITVHNETLTNSSVRKLLVNTVQDVSKEEIENRTSNLLLLAWGKSSKKKWTTFHLFDKIVLTNEDTLENIKSAIRRKGMLANVNMVPFRNRFVLSVEKKFILKRGSRLRKQLPIYFQFFPNEPYLFCTRSSIENKIRNSIVEALGYSNWKLCKLIGRNVSDLLTLLKNKERGRNSPSLLFSDPECVPKVTTEDSVARFDKKKEREKYAEEIFGTKPPQLESFKVSLRNSTWVQTGDFDKMNGTSLDGVSATFKAPNIAEFFKEMIALGAVSHPIPDYMKFVMYAGKNDINITRSEQ